MGGSEGMVPCILIPFLSGDEYSLNFITRNELPVTYPQDKAA
jgi:hypothetical protein